MERLTTNKRKIHRKITAISAIPLLITIVSGTIVISKGIAEIAVIFL